MLDAEHLGKLRQGAHTNSPSKRLYKDKNLEHIIGITGEIKFGERYNLKPDLEIRPNGDGGVDFKVKFNDKTIVTIDIKTSQKAWHLLIKEWDINRCSDILVLCKYHDKDNVEFLGWTTKKVMKEQPKKVFPPLNINSYYLHNTKLNKMEILDLLFSKSKVEQL
jgi:hypothetical protein